MQFFQILNWKYNVLSYRLINMADNMVKHEYIIVSIVFF